jgi:hypothetical protein
LILPEGCSTHAASHNAVETVWRCVESGEPLASYRRHEHLEFLGRVAGLFRSTRHHERSKAELKALMPEDAEEVIGHGVRAKTLEIRRDQL